jgi:hypothetical protein
MAAVRARGSTVFLGCGFAAKYPEGGGNFSVPIQWMRGLLRLGLDAVWLELLPASEDPERAWIPLFARQMAEHGFDGRWCLLYQRQEDHAHALEQMEGYGWPLERLRERLRGPSVLLNLSYSIHPPLLLAFERRVLCDLDPAEMAHWMLRVEMGQSYHHEFVTIGLNIDGPDYRAPGPPVRWRPVFPLVDTTLYAAAPAPPRRRFTTVGQWYWKSEIEVNGDYPDFSKGAAFEKYLALPAAVPDAELELAMNFGSEDPAGERLRRHGWKLAHPHEVAGTPAAYRAYIAGSLAEFTACKGLDVVWRTGWLSDRAAAYLASGRPVITEDTGARAYLPEDSGLLWVSNVEQAREAVREVLRDWPRLSRLARQTSVEFCDAARTLTAILAG